MAAVVVVAVMVQVAQRIRQNADAHRTTQVALAKATAATDHLYAVFSDGAAGRSVRVSCREVGGAMQARARVTLAAWVPGVPSWSFTVTGAVVKEHTP